MSARSLRGVGLLFVLAGLVGVAACSSTKTASGPVYLPLGPTVRQVINRYWASQRLAVRMIRATDKGKLPKARQISGRIASEARGAIATAERLPASITRHRLVRAFAALKASMYFFRRALAQYGHGSGHHFGYRSGQQISQSAIWIYRAIKSARHAGVTGIVVIYPPPAQAAVVTPTPTPTPQPTPSPQPTAAPQPTPRPTPTPAPTLPSVLLDQTGSGIKNTAPFQAPGTWVIEYSYNCSNFGQAGNFQVYVYQGTNLVDTPVNELKLRGSGQSYEYQSGLTHLQINSECNWHVKAYAS